MKIGIIGSGNMGRTLGLLWATKGHEVFFGARNPATFEAIHQLARVPVQTGTLAEAVSFGQVLLYNLRDVLPTQLLPADAWAGKIIIDDNNGEVPPDFTYPPILQAYAERYQADVPQANVVKAFNTLAQELYNQSTDYLAANRVTGFFCGNDAGAKAIVAQLSTDAGLVPLDCGPLSLAKSLESLADLVRYLMSGGQQGPYLALCAKVLLPVESHPFGDRQASKYK